MARPVVSIVRWNNVPLPEGHLGALVAGLVLHKVFPLRVSAPTLLRRVIGPLFASLGVLLAAWAVVAARDLDVTTPTTVVTRGPYAHTRNPMYLGWTLLYLGIALVAGSRWLLILLPLVLAYTHAAVLREERYLETRFGRDYRLYRERVRRYL
jgi:protein-S-isoprenylcysteine O-methyltransferase Ste14